MFGHNLLAKLILIQVYPFHYPSGSINKSLTDAENNSHRQQQAPLEGKTPFFSWGQCGSTWVGIWLLFGYISGRICLRQDDGGCSIRSMYVCFLESPSLTIHPFPWSPLTHCPPPSHNVLHFSLHLPHSDEVTKRGSEGGGWQCKEGAIGRGV